MYQEPDHNYTTVMQTTHPFPNAVRSSEARQLKRIFVLLLITGTLSIVFNTIGLIYREIMSDYGHGFWCGIMVS